MSMVDKIRSGIAVMKPAAEVCVALFQQDDGSKTVWGIVHTDHDGASDVVDCGYSDLNTARAAAQAFADRHGVGGRIVVRR